MYKIAPCHMEQSSINKSYDFNLMIILEALAASYLIN